MEGTAPGTGSNFDKVDEATPNGDTDYVFDSVEGDFDLYTLTDLPAGFTFDVLAVQTTFNANTSDAGAKFIRPHIRSGGSEATGTSRALAASYLSYMEVFEDNPVTTKPPLDSCRG
jgi:hypothetical protein